MASSSIRGVTSQATLEEKKKLRKEFRLFDMIFYTVAALIGLDTLGAFAANGSQALTWVIIAAITFLLPYGLLTAELGSTFTQEGGMYEWCKMAGGRLFAALGAILYWVSNPLWVGGSLSVAAIAAIKTFWFGDPNYHFFGSIAADAATEIVIALIFIWATTWCAIASLSLGKWLSVVGSYIKLGLLALFILCAIVFLAGGHSKGGSLVVGDLIPSNWGLIVSSILPVIIFQYVGFELQNGAGEEMEDPQRDVPRSLIRAGATAAVAYIAFVVVILLALSKDQLSNVGGFFSAFQAVTSVLPSGVATVLGWVVALAFVVTLASSASTWIIGADRTYAIAALDRTAPVFLGRFSGRYGTPIAVNTMSGIVASIAMIAGVLITAFGSGNITTLFSLVLGFTISTTTLSYLFIFPAFIILRYKYPNVRRVYKVPGGMLGAWIVTLLPLAYAAIGSWFILFPTDAVVTSAKVSRLTYELSQLVPLAIIVLLTVVFYVWGHMEKRNRDVIVEINVGTADETVLSTGAAGE